MITRLVDAYEVWMQDHIASDDGSTETEHFLYQLLQERPPEANISHRSMPTLAQHCAYFRSNPHPHWYLVQEWPAAYEEAVFERKVPAWVGTVYLTKAREVGVFILRKRQREGFARRAIAELQRLHPGRLLANVAPQNHVSHALFTKLGARVIQHTYELPEEEEKSDGKEEAAAA